MNETPLAADQVLTADEEGRLHLVATVPNTRALVWWVLGFGDGVVIEEPASLREELAEIAQQMAAAYTKSASTAGGGTDCSPACA